MGLIRCSCGHILGHHEPIHVKFGVWRFFIMLYRNMVMKMLKCKQFFFDDVTLRYSIRMSDICSGDNLINDNVKRNTNPNLTLTLNLILILSLPRTKNLIITHTLTL